MCNDWQLIPHPWKQMRVTALFPLIGIWGIFQFSCAYVHTSAQLLGFKWQNIQSGCKHKNSILEDQRHYYSKLCNLEGREEVWKLKLLGLIWKLAEGWDVWGKGGQQVGDRLWAEAVRGAAPEARTMWSSVQCGCHAWALFHCLSFSYPRLISEL